MVIRKASVKDQVHVSGVLTLAFSTDPMARWSLPDSAKYLEVFASITMAFGGKALSRERLM